MGRGRRGLLDELSVLPWPVGAAVGVIGYFGIRYGIPALFATQAGPLARAFTGGMFVPLAWLFLGMCLVAATVSFFNARHRRRLLDTRTGLESIAAVGWRDFERLVGEAFRRQGYAVEETGLGGADGGIDLVLRRDGRRILVQCKQWRRTDVPVNVVREMYGLLAHHKADAVKIAALGGFTRDAARFAAGKPIELIHGSVLLAMVRSVQASGATTGTPARVEPAFRNAEPRARATPACPRCGESMVERTNRQTGSAFWGCSAFPRCRGTQ
ncbi:MAG: restriction endonuclease [Pseudoxanthomonas sp.]|nr:restriction endonuclease [Pseudoxanthomonas sp.]